jgi:hypothetical protein
MECRRPFRVDRVIFGRRLTTSGLSLETDIVRAGRRVSNVPAADFQRKARYVIGPRRRFPRLPCRIAGETTLPPTSKARFLPVANFAAVQFYFFPDSFDLLIIREQLGPAFFTFV